MPSKRILAQNKNIIFNSYVEKKLVFSVFFFTKHLLQAFVPKVNLHFWHWHKNMLIFLYIQHDLFQRKNVHLILGL